MGDSEELFLRLGFFFGVLVLMALWELVQTTRHPSQNKAKRWARHFQVSLLNSLVLRFVFPITALGMAVLSEEKGIGLLNVFGVASNPFAILATIVILDFCIYCQHVVFHMFRPLWKIHQMHHADQDFDCTTGFRFHPIEIVFSMLMKCVLIAAIGASPQAVLIFEIILSSGAIFNHSNVSLPAKLEAIMRIFFVTPDMHRVHHSTLNDEMLRNFGFNLPWWDRLFGTYTVSPKSGHAKMEIGIAGCSDKEELLPITMLAIPFVLSTVETNSTFTARCMRPALCGMVMFFSAAAYLVLATI